MSGTETGIQDVDRPDSEDSVNFEDPRDEDESNKVFDEKNVTPATVPQPYVSLKSSDVLRSILAPLSCFGQKSG